MFEGFKPIYIIERERLTKSLGIWIGSIFKEHNSTVQLDSTDLINDKHKFFVPDLSLMDVKCCHLQ